MSATDQQEQDAHATNPNLTEVQRAPASLEDMNRLLLSMSQSLAIVMAEQHSVQMRMEEMTAERTAPPGFERLPLMRELLQGQSSQPAVLNAVSNPQNT